MQSARIWNWAQTFSAIYCLNIQLIGHTRATKHTCQSHVPILLHMKNGWVQTKGAIFQVVYQIQIWIPGNKSWNADLLSHIHLLMSNPNVFSLQQKKELASLFQYFWRALYMYICYSLENGNKIWQELRVKLCQNKFILICQITLIERYVMN